MIEGCGSGVGSVLVNNGSGCGSGKPKNIWIHNTAFHISVPSHFTSVADPDPGSGIGYLFDPWLRDPGWEKVSIRTRDPG
jgi:hypothetical protein